MFCGLNWKDNVAGGQGLFRDGFLVKNWHVSKLPRSSLARRCVEATLLCGWAQICNLQVRNFVGFHAIELPLHPRVRYCVGFHAIA